MYYSWPLLTVEEGCIVGLFTDQTSELQTSHCAVSFPFARPPCSVDLLKVPHEAPGTHYQDAKQPLLPQILSHIEDTLDG